MTARSATEIRAWLIATLTNLLEGDGAAPPTLHDRVAFRELGIDSVRGSTLVVMLGAWLGRDVEPAMLYDHPTVRALADALTGTAPRSPAPAPATASPDSQLAVAIVGIGCRFAGADGVQGFWELLRDNVDAIAPRPAARAELPESRHWRGLTRSDACFREGGYLPDVDRFDARFFGISEAEATRMDPQQRLLLEVTHDAFEDAAIAPSSIRGSSTGVYVGIATTDYGVEQLGVPSEVDVYTGAGSAASMAANRLSYVFDLQGPSMAIDTACSSSAVAIYQACLALRRGEISLAVAAGVNVILSPSVTMNFVQAGVMAGDARCKVFSAAADGYVRAEGVGVIILKPLAQAQLDGDRIYAVVLGGAVGHGGRSNGLMSPSARGQARVLEAALGDAGVKPRDLDYIEAHGTGTFIGDPIEANALGRALAVGLARTRKCWIGSVKTNIGHTEAAAGIAGVIKVALSLYHRTIPASLHAAPANEQIRFDVLPIAVASVNQPWPGRPGHACASVASVGFGGTNCQLVLAEAAHPVARRRAGALAAEPILPPGSTADDDQPWMLPLSSLTTDGLQRTTAAWITKARGLVEAGKVRELRTLVDRAARGRDHHARRAAFVASDAAGLLRALEGGRAIDTGAAAQPIFVCPGQGSQWLGMGRALVAHEPVFQAAFAACDAALRRHGGPSVLDLLVRDEHGTYLTDIALVQPTLFAFQVALAALWQSLGIIPAAVVGHSMGEVAAAHIAGALSLDDAARVIALRSQLMKRVGGNGMMALVELTVVDALALIAPYEGQVSIAASNSPTTTVLSGDAAAVAAVLQVLDARGVFARAIRVDVASHSPQVDSILDELRELLASIEAQPPRIPMWSTVNGRWVEGPELDADYWLRNLREPVRFAQAIAALAETPAAFVELSPHPVLLSSIEQCVQHANLTRTVVASVRRDRPERLGIAEGLAQLYQAGCPVQWPAQGPATVSAFGWAPGYAWDDQRYWWSPPAHVPTQAAVAVAAAASIVGSPRWEDAAFWDQAIEPATSLTVRIWRFQVDPGACGVIESHRVAGRVVLPAALFLALGVQAAASSWRAAADSLQLEHVRFHAPVVADAASELQLVFEDTSAPDRPLSTARIQLFVRASAARWQLASEAAVRTADPIAAGRPLDLPAHIESWPERHDDRALYQELARLGVQYGNHFQGLKAIWRADGRAIGQIIPSAEVAAGRSHYPAHPAVIDAAFQLAWAALEPEAREHSLRTGTARVPAEVERIQIWPAAQHDPGGYWAIVQRRADHAWTVEVFDGAGTPRVRIDGLRLAQVRAASFVGSALVDACFTLAWQDRAGEPGAARPAAWLVIGDPADPLAEALGAELRARGHQVRPSTAAQVAPQEHVLYVPAPDHDAPHEPLLSLVQAFARDELPRWQSLTIVTRNAQAVQADDRPVALAHAPLWGLGRVIAAELPGLPTRLLDVDADQRASLIVDELHAREREVGLRTGLRRVPRLIPTATPTSDRALALRADASYLVTGGGGALGNLVARAFVAAGAGRVILCGRQPAPSPEIAAWLGAEPRARYVAVDVADRAAVAQLLGALNTGAHPLAGIVHAAGLLRDATLAHLTAEDFTAVLRPKREGMWNLHTLTAGLALDFFVVFSSATALVGSPGQANYAAANAYVDALCSVRRGEGKPALAINWGPWADIGLAATRERGERLDELGIRSIAPAAGLGCLIALLEHRTQGQLVVFPHDPARLRATGGLAGTPVLEQPARGATTAGVPSLAPAPPRERPALDRLESFLQAELAVVLRRPVAEVEVDTPFPELGLESLEVLRFKNRIEAALGLVLPATAVWKHPTIRALAKRLEAELGATPARSL